MLRRGFSLHNMCDVPFSGLDTVAFVVLLGFLRFAVPVLLTMCHHTASMAQAKTRGRFAVTNYTQTPVKTEAAAERFQPATSLALADRATVATRHSG
jgi:hypothetical protein